MATARLRDPDPGRRLFGFQRPTALRSTQSSRDSACSCDRVDRCCFMHSRFGVLYLGQVHARAKLERRRDLQRRPRTDTRGPYALVRHPIYTGLLTMFVATVIVLGHVAGIIAMPLVYVSVWFR